MLGNRPLHTLGIPMIVVAIVLAIAGVAVPARLPYAAAVFVIGWI